MYKELTHYYESTEARRARTGSYCHGQARCGNGSAHQITTLDLNEVECTQCKQLLEQSEMNLTDRIISERKANKNKWFTGRTEVIHNGKLIYCEYKLFDKWPQVLRINGINHGTSSGFATVKALKEHINGALEYATR